MGEPRPLKATTRAAWRRWLMRNHATTTEVWLQFGKARSGKPTVTYEAAVEEALCFGWIDTTVRRLDDDYYVQRFTPRTNLRNWSAPNLARFDRMVAQGLMTEAGLAKRPPGTTAPPRRLQSDDPIPAFVVRALKANPAARANFDALAPGYRRDYLRWITEAKRPETRERRLAAAIQMLAANRKRVQGPEE